MRKRSFTLIELALSMALFSLLLVTLISSYRQLKTTKDEDAHAKKIWEERYFDQRLALILKRLDLKGVFIGDDQSFCFIFDQGTHPNPLLAGKVLAKFYYDPNAKALALTYWPHPSTKESSSEVTLVLLENVDAFSCEYYFPPPSQKNGVNPSMVGDYPHIGWQPVWKKAFLTQPPLIKMEITRFDEKKFFAFDLPPYKVRSDL